jgi:hypothetical protein
MTNADGLVKTTFMDRIRMFAAVAAGLGPTWWSDKHNKHHALSKIDLAMAFLVCLFHFSNSYHFYSQRNGS